VKSEPRSVGKRPPVDGGGLYLWRKTPRIRKRVDLKVTNSKGKRGGLAQLTPGESTAIRIRGEEEAASGISLLAQRKGYSVRGGALAKTGSVTEIVQLPREKGGKKKKNRGGEEKGGA